MATFGDDSMDGYLYSAYNPYSYRYLGAKSKGAAWRHKSYLSPYGSGDGDASFDNQQRAQLRSILSQINPNLTPRLRRANTRDVGVQVNPRADASVQCSLGPRTLVARRREALRRRRQETQVPGSPVGGAGGGIGAVRYPRTLAVYSPIASRRLSSFLQAEEEEEKEEEEEGKPEEPEREQGPEEREAQQVDQDKGDKLAAAEEEEKEGKVEKVETTGEKAQPADSDPGTTLSVEEQQQKGAQEGAKTKARVRFQFLEQKYGYYHCKDCNLRWESAYVWCVQGTNKVYFKQFCRTCQKAFNPYRVEDITCQTCKRARCTCSVTQRHVDPKRPHRQDLCGRCKGKRLSCDSTFSFKYII